MSCLSLVEWSQCRERERAQRILISVYLGCYEIRDGEWISSSWLQLENVNEVIWSTTISFHEWARFCWTILPFVQTCCFEGAIRTKGGQISLWLDPKIRDQLKMLDLKDVHTSFMFTQRAERLVYPTRQSQPSIANSTPLAKHKAAVSFRKCSTMVASDTP